MSMRIVLTGGGTGGHAYPAISIAEELRSRHPDYELLYIGGKDSIEERLAASAGIPFFGLVTRKIKKVLSPDSVLVMGALAMGFSEAMSYLNRCKPDLVIGTGGYASAAVVMAQTLRRGKTLIHEQNVIPGRTNMLVSRFASKVCVTFDDTTKYFPVDKTIVTGLPVRSELLKLPDRNYARKLLGLDPDKFTLLVYGGSQGAKSFNKIIEESLPELRKMPIQIIHQVGKRNIKEAEQIRMSAGWDNYHVFDYFDDVRPVFKAADLMLTRCGASSIAEITIAGIPAILIPYPYAYADHQSYNGDVVARNGGGILVKESDLTVDLLVDTIKILSESPAKLEHMRKAVLELGKPNAARDIVKIAIDLIEN
ncbi:MAG: undecaprenyldiphospho-muramoylpentapeptide beta-N-acetylglucosaminyltransferase [Armatimonadota bacterium]